jgi:hypothetical protein
MKNLNNTIGNRTRDLPSCSTMPQPTAPLRTPNFCLLLLKMNYTSYSPLGYLIHLILVFHKFLEPERSFTSIMYIDRCNFDCRLSFVGLSHENKDFTVYVPI